MSDRIIVYTGAYNAEKTIPRTIESIQAQTYTNWVYYIVDDASTDGTADILSEYGGKDSRIHYATKEKNQVSDIEDDFNWHSIIKNYDDSDWLCWIDADDEYKPEFFKTALEFANMNNLDIVLCGNDIINAETGELEKTRALDNDLILDGSDNYDELFPVYHRFMRTTWGKLLKISLVRKFDKTRHPLSRYGSDTSFAIENFRNADRIGILSGTLHKYYVSTKSSSFRMDHDRLICDRVLDDLTRCFLEDKCGVVSPQNDSFLCSVYFWGINDTLNLLVKSHSSVTELLGATHEVLINNNVKHLIAWDGYHDKKAELFDVILKWIEALKKGPDKKQFSDNPVSAELEIFLKNALSKPDIEIFNFLLNLKKNCPKVCQKLDIDEEITKIIEKYPLLTGMTADIALFFSDAVCAVISNDLQTVLDEVIRLSETDVPAEYFESYLIFAQYVCAAVEYAEGWLFFKKLFADFLIKENRQKEAKIVIDELEEIDPSDEEVIGLKEELESIK